MKLYNTNRVIILHTAKLIVLSSPFLELGKENGDVQNKSASEKIIHGDWRNFSATENIKHFLLHGVYARVA